MNIDTILNVFQLFLFNPEKSFINRFFKIIVKQFNFCDSITKSLLIMQSSSTVPITYDILIFYFIRSIILTSSTYFHVLGMPRYCVVPDANDFREFL